MARLLVSAPHAMTDHALLLMPWSRLLCLPAHLFWAILNGTCKPSICISSSHASQCDKLQAQWHHLLILHFGMASCSVLSSLFPRTKQVFVGFDRLTELSSLLALTGSPSNSSHQAHSRGERLASGQKEAVRVCSAVIPRHLLQACCRL